MSTRAKIRFGIAFAVWTFLWVACSGLLWSHKITGGFWAHMVVQAFIATFYVGGLFVPELPAPVSSGDRRG